MLASRDHAFSTCSDVCLKTGFTFVNNFEKSGNRVTVNVMNSVLAKFVLLDENTCIL
jgi:hypothetical protein